MENKTKNPWSNPQSQLPKGWGQENGKPVWDTPPSANAVKPPFSPPQTAKAPSNTSFQKPTEGSFNQQKHPVTMPKEQPAIVPKEQPAAAFSQNTYPKQSKPSPTTPSGRWHLLPIFLTATLALLTVAAGILLLSSKTQGSAAPTPSEPSANHAPISAASTETSTNATVGPTVSSEPPQDDPASTTQPEPSSEPAAPLDLSNYRGTWWHENSPSTTLEIHETYEDYVIFSLWFFRTASFQYVGGWVSGNEVSFSTLGSAEAAGIYGTLTFTDIGILLSILESDFEYIPVQQIYYNVHEASQPPTAPITSDVPYTIPLNTTAGIFSTPDPHSECIRYIDQSGIYTIVEETYDQFGNLWGKLKSGAGWVMLDP